MESPDTDHTPTFTAFATRDGLVLSTPKGQFLLYGYGNRSGADRGLDPIRMFSLLDSDPRKHQFQLEDFAF